MLRAGRVPVPYRGARVGSGCFERLVVNSFGAPARAGRLQHPPGFRFALRRASLFAPAPHLAIYARRESIPGASLRLRSRGERAAEVRLALCLTYLWVTSPVVQAPQAGAPITVWVKRMDIAGARYVAVKGVDTLEVVDEFIARWVAQAKLDVDPSLVTLRLVKCGTGKPTLKQEGKAKVLDDPSLSLAEAKVTGTPWLLAFVAGTKASAEKLALSAILSALCLADYALLEESSEHKDLFFLGPAGSGPRAFFMDADRAVTSQALGWLKTARSKWRGVMNENDPDAVSMTITGTPKTGKTLMLTKVLPALIAEDELFGVGREAEARIFRLSTDGFDRKNGETGFLLSLLDELLRQADLLGYSELQRVRQYGNVVACLKAFVDLLPHNVPHFILVDEVQNFFLLTKPDGSLDGQSVDQMRRIFKSLVGSSPIHCTWVVTGSSMATYWANLALAPVNGFSILNHLPSVHLPTRVENDVLERARAVLRQEFSSSAPLPEPLLLFSEAHTVAELVFYATEWYRLGASAAKPPIEFCLDTLADKVYPEIVSDFWRVLSAMDVASRLLVVQLVNSELGVEQSKLPRGLLRYFRPYMRPTAHESSVAKLVYVDSPIVYAALAALVDVKGNVVSQLDASLLIVDFPKLARFCGFGDKLSEWTKTRHAGDDFFGSTPLQVIELLSAWSDKLEPSFWASPADNHWFNVTFRDPFHGAARRELEASAYEPWQYLHWFLRLWRNSVEHKKKQSVAASFAHMRTLPHELLMGYELLEALMVTL